MALRQLKPSKEKILTFAQMSACMWQNDVEHSGKASFVLKTKITRKSNFTELFMNSVVVWAGWPPIFSLVEEDVWNFKCTALPFLYADHPAAV